MSACAGSANKAKPEHLWSGFFTEFDIRHVIPLESLARLIRCVGANGRFLVMGLTQGLTQGCEARLTVGPAFFPLRLAFVSTYTSWTLISHQSA